MNTPSATWVATDLPTPAEVYRRLDPDWHEPWPGQLTIQQAIAEATRAGR